MTEIKGKKIEGKGKDTRNPKLENLVKTAVLIGLSAVFHPAQESIC